MTYKNYDRETYLNSFKEIMKLKPQVEKYIDDAFEKGVDNLVMAGVGGSISIMMPMEYFAKKRTAMPVYMENAAELVLGINKAITEKSLVVLYSESGTTKEAIAAAEY